jgi:alpha-glucosidase
VLSNHDVVRHTTRFALPDGLNERRWLLDGDRALLDAEGGLRRARAASLLAMALPGSVYLYQGEELGLPEVHDLPPAALDDPTWEASGRTLKGRDGCRVPLPWTVDGPSHGFGNGGSWLPMPDGWGALSVEAQDGRPGSTLEMYRAALAIRRSHLLHVDMEWLDLGPDAIAFRRRDLICVVNFGPDQLALPAGEVVVASDTVRGRDLGPESTAWLVAG